MESVETESAVRHPCPSCGRPTALTSYGPEPALCVDCQRSFGLLREPGAARAAAPEATPENPRWGIVEAAALLIASILALLAVEIGAVGYIVYEGRMGLPIPAGDALVTDPTLTVVRIVSSGAAHVVTILLAWYVVTDGGREPFFRSIGWGWRPRYTPLTVLSVFVAIFLINILLTRVFDVLGLTPQSTPFDELLKLPGARVAIAVFAVVSAPFVEEVVYRGVLYPALARRAGRVAAILMVSAIFLYVHVDQYGGAIAYLLPLGLLSLTLTSLRAYSGSLLPSFALHLLFNGIQVIFILFSDGK
jgi:membrane protease YdiL (CAAX protease family)